MPNAPGTLPAPNPTLIVPFVNAVREVFKTMAGVDTVVGRPHYKAASASASAHRVRGVIGFHGQLTGSVVVGFSDTAAERLVEAFVGTALKRDEPDFADAIGELANMIAGSAKGKLETVTSISTPSVIIGDCTLAGPSNVPCVVIPCQCVHGEFTVEVSIKPQAQAA